MVEGINSDGTYSCVDPSGDIETQNLSETLSAGNVANQTIDMDGDNIALNGGYLSGDGDNEGLYVADNGDVGLGVSNPNQDLDVSDIRLRSGDIGVDFTTNTDSNGENFLIRNADSSAGQNEGRTQVELAPSGSDSRAFINVYGNSDLSNSGLTRFGGRNNAGIFNVQNFGTPSETRDAMGFEIDPSNSVSGEGFRFGTDAYMFAGNQPDILFEINHPTKTSEQIYVPVADSNSQGLVVEGASSQSADLLQIRSNGASSGDLLSVDSSGNLDMTGGNISNYFGNACSGGNAAVGIYDNGTINCADSGNLGTDDQNLSEVLVNGNTANQTIDVGDNSINDLSSVDGGGDSINFDDNLDTSNVNITAGGNVTIGTDLRVWGDIWTRGDVPAENLSETLSAGNSAGNNNIDLNNNNIQNVNQISGNSEAIDVSNDLDISQKNVNDAKAVQFGGGSSGERLVKKGGDLCLGDEC